MTQYSTYCPEDNKLRLYVGRVPRPEYEALRAEGWTSTPKQDCNFVATWTPERRDTALKYGDGVIEDEDQEPAERAAQRAERFAGYRDKREGEATGHADRYDSGPAVHGFQSQARADRSAARHDRIGTKATDAWSKAEYWQGRTAGVISHALYKSLPAVRMGRIKVLEAELRARVKSYEEAAEKFDLACKIRDIADPVEQNRVAELFVGCGTSYDYRHPDHPEEKNSLYGHMTSNRFRRITGAEAMALYLRNCSRPDVENSDWANHFKMRLAYENQMLEAEGGRAAMVEMQVGGWIGSHQIRKVNKSNVTGRVVSVEVMGKTRGFSKASGYTREETKAVPVLMNIERLSMDSYTPPTPEDVASMEAIKKAEKESAPKKESCPLINPTEEDAAKLQALLNGSTFRRGYQPRPIVKMTFAQYSVRGKTTVICEDGTEHRSRYGTNITRHDVLKVRTIWTGDGYGGPSIVVLTDKPQKGIPWDKLEKAKASCPSEKTMVPRLIELDALVNSLQDYRQRTNEEHQFLRDGEYLGWINAECSTPRWTESGAAVLKRYREAGVTAALINAGESLA